jgi:hypothetical protein
MASIMSEKPPKYKWDEERGIVDAKTGDQKQQLIFTTTKAFRRKCGKLLVEALNEQT